MNLEVPIEDLRKKRIFVATPMYGGQCFGSFTKSVLDLSRQCQQYGITATFSFIFNESLITRARNYLVDEFLRSEYDVLVFIDSDIDFNPTDVLALVALDRDVIGGPYPKKAIAWETVIDAVRYGLVDRTNAHDLSKFAGDFVFNVAPGTTEIRLDQPAEVLEIGTGFMAVKRETLLKFREHYGEKYAYNPDHNRSAAFDGSRKIYQYFQAEIVETIGREGHERYLSEDYWFCQKVREMGASVWLCPWMEIKHHGTHIYTGSIPAYASVVQKRIESREAAPSATYMDYPNNVAPKPQITHIAQGPQKIPTVAEFRNLSSAQRRANLEQWAKKADMTVESFTKLYTDSLSSPDLDQSRTITDHIASLVASLKAE